MQNDEIVEREVRREFGWKCPSCGRIPQIGEWPFDCFGRGHRIQPRDAQIHTSERVVVLRNPQTGEVRIPGRADAPMCSRYEQCGFVREEIATHSALRQLEREQGVIHEASNYDGANSPQAERDCTPPPIPTRPSHRAG